MKRILLWPFLMLLLAGCGREVPASLPSEAIPLETVGIATEVISSPTQQEPAEFTLPAECTEPEDEDLVPIRAYIPDILVELKYAAEDNFTGKRIYDFSEPYLRYGTVKKLKTVQSVLAQQGLQLKIWDAFRPVMAQFTLWEIYPDPNYVANPTVGFSSHSRGNTVDVTIADLKGNELLMPTGFDDFSAMANRDYSDCTLEEAENAMLLQDLMEQNGFAGYFGEWWHFSDSTDYPVEKSFCYPETSLWKPVCENYISLRSLPDIYAEVITHIPKGETILLLAWRGDFALVDYDGQYGYVHGSYIEPV